jgi:phosphohistidine phosphatase
MREGHLDAGGAVFLPARPSVPLFLIFRRPGVDLFLIRHTEAVPLKKGCADADRPLTVDGEEQARLLAVGLQRKGVRFGKVFTSPLLRARQTAEHMLKNWSSPPPKLAILDELTPGTRPRKLAKALRELCVDNVALVGHQPDLGEWSAWLIGSRKARIDFAKGGVACIACNDAPAKAAGSLVWLVTPEWLQ